MKQAKKDIKATSLDPYGIATNFAEDFLHEKSLDVEHFSYARRDVPDEKGNYSVKKLRANAVEFATDIETDLSKKKKKELERKI